VTSDQGGGQERGGVDDVGLDGDRPGPDRPRMDPPRVHHVGAGRIVMHACRFHLGARGAQHLHGHGDVRGRGNPVAAMADLDALVEAGGGEQQAGDEL